MDTLSASEKRILTLGLLCTNEGFSNLKVDYEKLAIEAGLKNAHCASVLFSKARRKILQSVTVATGGNAGSDLTKKVAEDKVTKPRKSGAKGKGTNAVKSEMNTEDDGGAIDMEFDNEKPVKPTRAKVTKAGKRGTAATKAKIEPEPEFLSIKPEIDIKLEPYNEEFAEGTGTSVSRSPLDSDLENGV